MEYVFCFVRLCPIPIDVQGTCSWSAAGKCYRPRTNKWSVVRYIVIELNVDL